MRGLMLAGLGALVSVGACTGANPAFGDEDDKDAGTAAVTASSTSRGTGPGGGDTTTGATSVASGPDTPPLDVGDESSTGVFETTGGDVFMEECSDLLYGVTAMTGQLVVARISSGMANVVANGVPGGGMATDPYSGTIWVLPFEAVADAYKVDPYADFFVGLHDFNGRPNAAGAGFDWGPNLWILTTTEHLAEHDAEADATIDHGDLFVTAETGDVIWSANDVVLAFLSPGQVVTIEDPFDTPGPPENIININEPDQITGAALVGDEIFVSTVNPQNVGSSEIHRVLYDGETMQWVADEPAVTVGYPISDLAPVFLYPEDCDDLLQTLPN